MFIRKLGLLVVSLSFVISANGAEPNEHFHDALWVAESHGILKIAAAGGEIEIVVDSIDEIRAVAVDAVGGLAWVAGRTTLMAYRFDGEFHYAVDLDPSTTQSDDPVLSIDRRDGSIWLAFGRSLQIFASDGSLIASESFADPVAALAVDAEPGVRWVASRDRVERRNESGELLDALSVPKGEQIRDIAVDLDEQALWVITDRQVHWLDTNDQEESWQRSEKSFSLVQSLEDGSAWIAGNHRLLQLDRHGAVLTTFDYAQPGNLVDFAVDRLSGSLWVASEQHLARYGFDGALLDDYSFAGSGQQGRLWSVDLYVDDIPPTLVFAAPVAGTLTNNNQLPFEVHYEDIGIGVDPDTLKFAVNDATATFQCEQLDEVSSRCVPVHELPEGSNQVEATVADFNFNVSEPATVEITVDTISPEFLELSPQSGSTVSASPITVSGHLSEPAHLEVDGVSVAHDADLHFAVEVSLGEGANTIELVAVDSAGNVTFRELSIELAIESGGLPPNPEDVAPDLPAVGSPPFHEQNEFLYTGPDPIQRDVEPGTIEPERMSILRGSVGTRTGEPLSGVRIRVLDHPELGHTLSRADGRFDMAVNGGGSIMLVYEKDGYFPVQRRIHTGWNDWYHAEDVVMIQPDDQMTAIDLTDTSRPFQVHRSNPTEDADGQRQVTLLFPAGTTAMLTMPDGTEQPLEQLDVRATEYTVGADGPAAMPAPLPPASGYTYAVELSVDQVLEQGFFSNGRDVTFSQPVPFYVDNFLDFPAGEPVPTGFLDQTVGNWIPYENGRVIDILDIENGQAVLDVTGFGAPATETELEALGITDHELAELAEIYQAGDSLWRVALDHFSSWDCNWPYGPPEDAEEPPAKGPKLENEGEPEDSSEENSECGCVIHPQTRSLGEKVSIAGTPYSLHYRSGRAEGYKKGSEFSILLSEGDVADSLRKIKLSIDVAGERVQRTFAPEPNLEYEFQWDGIDASGRAVRGNAAARVSISYVYPCTYYGIDEDNGFGEFGDSANPIGTRSDCEGFKFTRRFKLELQSPINASAAVSNWSLSGDHLLLETADQLLRGDGQKRKFADSIIDTFAGKGGLGFNGDGGLAIDASIGQPSGIVFDADGSYYMVDSRNHVVRYVDSNGTISTVAGTGVRGFSGDGGPATEAKFSFPQGIALASDGSLYISDSRNHRIRRIDPQGIVSTVAGTGDNEYGGDGGPAIEARLNLPQGLAIGPDDDLYIAERSSNRIRRINADGVITTVAGNGGVGIRDGVPATEAPVQWPRYIAVGSDGSLYISATVYNRVQRVGADGIISTVAGQRFAGFEGDGTPATEARLNDPTGIAVSADNSLYIADSDNHRVRRVGPDGIIKTVAGSGYRFSNGDGGPALEAGIRYPSSVATHTDGSFCVVDNTRLRRVSPSGPLFVKQGTRSLSSRDGSRVFIFDDSGRHLRTESAHTGKVLQTFSRDEEGRLLEVTDVDGNSTRIERNGDGHGTAIIAPDGQRTDVEIDDDGHLIALQGPTGDRWSMAYTDNGLMTRFETPNGHANQFQYDSDGRLLRDIDPNGGGWTLSRTDLDEGYRVDMTSGEGRVHSYLTRRDFNGNRHYQRIAPDGTLTSRQHSASGMSLERPDGTRIDVKETPDPRFGMESPVPAQTSVALPSGLTLQAMVNRTVELDDDDGLNVLIDRVTVNDRETEIRFDTEVRQWTTTGPTGRQSVRLIDEVGRPVSILLDGLAPVHLDYDDRGRPATVVQGTGDSARTVSFTYHQAGDAAGYLATVTDPLGRHMHFEQDAAGRVTRQTLPDGRSIDYVYDGVGNLMALAPPGRNAHLFEYDGLDQRITYDPPEIDEGWTVTRYRYNLDRQLTEIERPDGQTVRYTWDDGSRLIRRTTDAGAVDYGYDSLTGRLIAMTAPDNMGLNFEYDGMLPTAEQWSGPVQGRVEWSYDANFWVREETVDGRSIAFSYDADGLLTGAGGLSLERDPAHGLIVGSGYGNIIGTRAYNSFGELMTREVRIDEADTYSVTYARDALGRIESLTETVGGVTSEKTYHYDPAGRLVQVARDGVITHTYSYDENSNRIEHSGPAGTIDADYDEQDRMLRYGDSFYTYNEAGDLTDKTGPEGTSTYDYDAAGNLRAVTLPDGTEIEYLIDGRDRRVGKRVDGQLEKSWIYRDQLSPVAQFDGDGNLTHRFVYAEQFHSPSYIIKIDPVTEEETEYRVVSDHLGSVRLVIDVETGAIVQQMDYGPFGQVINDTNPGFQPFGFAGGVYGRDTGLVRFGARDYDPVTGRWTAKDPIDFAAGETGLYNYVFNDPLNLVDPFGLEILYANHHVASGFYHSKIVMIPENQGLYMNEPFFQNLTEDGRRYATIGAGREDGTLLAGINRERDVNMPFGNATQLICDDEDEMIQLLIKMVGSYNENPLPYTAFPLDVLPEYNSNSFIHGIGVAAGLGMPTNTGARTPGYENPVPRHHFSK